MSLYLRLKQFLRSELQSSLNIKGLYLFGSTALSAVSGFLFWLVAVRQTSPADVGIASGMLASVNLLKSISELGFSSALIFYGGQKDIQRSQLVNTIIGINFISSMVVVAIYLLGLPIWASGLLLIRTFPLVLIFFAFTVIDTLLGMQDVVMLSLNKASFVFWRTIACNLPSFLLLPLLLHFSKNYSNIFIAYIIPNFIVFALSSRFILPKVVEGYHSFGAIDWTILKRIAKYGMVNQVGNIFWSLPAHTLPIIAVNILSPSQAGYFAINWTVINFVLIIPRVMSTSQYLESSQNIEQRWQILYKTLRTILLALVPAILLMWFLNPYIICLFDAAYINPILPRIFLLGTIPFTLASLYYILLRVEFKLVRVIVFAALIGLSSVGLSSILGLYQASLGIAYGWLIAYALPSLYVLGLLLLNLRKRPNP